MSEWVAARCTFEIRPGVRCSAPVGGYIDGRAACYRCAEPLIRKSHLLVERGDATKVDGGEDTRITDGEALASYDLFARSFVSRVEGGADRSFASHRELKRILERRQL